MIETEKRVREAVRYLGFGRNEADERTLELIQQSFKDLEQEAGPKSICQIFDLNHTDDGRLVIGQMEIRSKSLGYGDFDICYQEPIVRMLNCAKTIGLTLTDSFMMTPTKSVTAVIGISTQKDRCPISGCEVCTKKDCEYRR